MLNFMFFIAFVIFLAVVLSNIGLVLNFKKPITESPIYFRTPETEIEDKLLEAKNQLMDAREDLKSITVTMHDFNKKMCEAKTEIDATNESIKQAVKFEDNDDAKKHIRALGRQEKHLAKLKESEGELERRHEEILAEIDVKENEVITLKHELVMEGQGISANKNPQNIEDKLLQAAEDAEIEEKLEEFKKKYDDHNPT